MISREGNRIDVVFAVGTLSIHCLASHEWEFTMVLERRDGLDSGMDWMDEDQGQQRWLFDNPRSLSP